MTTFSELGLIDPLVRAVEAEGYQTPTPIQVQSIPPLLAGRDLLGCAQTGTGKTAAFALPLLQRLSTEVRTTGLRHVRVLVLAPTRELAHQIQDSFRTYGRNLPLKSTVIYGGVGQNPQVKAMQAGVDVLVATPGRLWDLMGQGHVKLDRLEAFVLDEADRMLDMGFIHDVRRIVAKLPARRQTMLFSATMPTEILHLTATLLHDPVRVEVTPVASTAERIEQRVLFVRQADKRALLEHLLADPAVERALVFTRTKHGANRVAEHLEHASVPAQAIHGNKSQNARQRALDEFKSGRVRVLVATDIAARGIDIDGISHVINYDMPVEPEAYVHRIGRTARAGAVGVAWSLCDHDERQHLRSIERVIRQPVPVEGEHPFQPGDPRYVARAPEQDDRPARGARPPSRPSKPESARPGYRPGQPGGQHRAAHSAGGHTPAGGQPQSRPVQAGAKPRPAEPAKSANPARSGGDWMQELNHRGGETGSGRSEGGRATGGRSSGNGNGRRRAG